MQYLLIDFGSTFTKLTAVDLAHEEVMAAAKSPSTVGTDITIGYNLALAELEHKLSGIPHRFEEKLACSSAAGGLKIIASGLVPELTAEAAKRAALGAGARILNTYSFELAQEEIKEIREATPDIILLAGGTDGGNKDCILGNARTIAEELPDIPVIVAGNKKALTQIEEIFLAKGVFYRTSANVMPRLNVLNVEPVRETIKQLFIERIIEAKGMKKVESFIGNVLMPTPAAVLQAAQLLADGTDRENGLGEVMLIDIGGATTDVHTISNPDITAPGATRRGLPEPYAKRTVEGDLGMRVSARALWEVAGSKRINKFIPVIAYDAEERCSFLANHVTTIGGSPAEREFDQALGCTAAELAVERHAGVLTSQYTPTGIIYIQEGKNLQDIKRVIGTGGVLIHSTNPRRILQTVLMDEESGGYLKPVASELLLDQEYILSAMGLLAVKHPDKALRMMKKYLKKV
ncbi:MAG: hypothetical protein AWM53_01485 [Candidatus Dichloromethanomonas elyunquensis]|nr:MAG: hypothetical protein AWM53_01485 [Candidatus Dichloromethanomonas elyunquensis]